MPRLQIGMSPREVDGFLETARTVRLATAGPDGTPHVVPLWFVWYDRTMFLNTTLGNLTIENLDGRPRAAGVVDAGEGYDEIRGVELRGDVERAAGDPRLEEVAGRWSAKYLGGAPVPFDRWRGRVWLRLAPGAVRSWDFRKIPEARARRDAAR